MSRGVNASGGRYQVDFFRVLRETEEIAALFEAQRNPDIAEVVQVHVIDKGWLFIGNLAGHGGALG